MYLVVFLLNVSFRHKTIHFDNTPSLTSHARKQTNKRPHLESTQTCHKMVPKVNPIVMALAAAYCALASPINTQPDYVQEVIDTLKVQLEADNVTDASAFINAAEMSLLDNGVLKDDVVAKLNQQIQVSKRTCVADQSLHASVQNWMSAKC